MKNHHPQTIHFYLTFILLPCFNILTDFQAITWTNYKGKTKVSIKVHHIITKLEQMKKKGKYSDRFISYRVSRFVALGLSNLQQIAKVKLVCCLTQTVLCVFLTLFCCLFPKNIIFVFISNILCWDYQHGFVRVLVFFGFGNFSKQFSHK